MKYLQLKSLTWWAGFSAIVLGLFAMFRPDYGPASELSHVLTLLLGGSDSSPAGLIVLGTGMIGIRAKLEDNADRVRAQK